MSDGSQRVAQPCLFQIEAISSDYLNIRIELLQLGPNFLKGLIHAKGRGFHKRENVVKVE